jgi:hypothetical protein
VGCAVERLSGSFFTSFGPTLARSGELRRDTYQFVRCGPEAIAAGQSAAGARWLANLLEQDASLYFDMPSSRQAFRSAVMGRWVAEPTTDFEVQVERIRALAGWHRKWPAKAPAGG